MPASKTALPKYLQIAEMLIRDVASGRLEDGARLPPEREMASELGIAVGTLRKALCDLKDKGLLHCVHGSGNYIRFQPEAVGVYAFFRLERLEGGGLPSAEVLSAETVPPETDLPVFKDSPKVHRIRRIRMLAAEPVALEEIYLDGRWTKSISPEDLSDSLYHFYRRKLRLWIATAEDRVGICEVPEWSVPAFAPRIGAISGYVERRGRTTDGQTAEFSRTWFDSDRARYVNRLR